VQEFIEKRGVTKCPGMGDPALAAIHIQRHQQWLQTVGAKWKNSLGFETDSNELAELPPELPVRRA
jgi:hypothetical protein